MQVIPRDWQSKIEFHIVSMRDAFADAVRHRVKTENDLGYVVACQDFVEHLEDAYGGLKEFDNFLKSDIGFALAAKGYAPRSNQNWDDTPQLAGGACEKAEFMAETYNSLYKYSMSAVMLLPDNGPRSKFAL
jgi:hypothetical protein